jgi:hypothetical protein
MGKMSEHLVHTAILRDSFRLFRHFSDTSERLKRIVNNYLAFAALGCITVSGDTFSFRLLEKYRNVSDDPYLDAKISFVFGWISHRACDRIMKPIWREAPFKGRGTDVDPSISPYECSIYHEAEAHKLFFNNEKEYEYALFTERMDKDFRKLNLQQDIVYQLIQSTYATNLISIQTIPDTLPEQELFENICMRLQKFYVDINRYTRAIETPDADNYAEYVKDICWYDPNDRIVSIAQLLRRNKPVELLCTEEVLQTKAKSYYGKALALSVSYLYAADQYLEDKQLNTQWLKDKLDIGKLGPGGLHV